MAFSAEQVESASPDAWTGKPTALVYETVAEAAAWLVARRKTAFDGLDEADQEGVLIEATEAAEDAIRRRFRGIPVTEDQGLLLPADGAYDNRGVLMHNDTAPRQYLEGIRLIAEAMADETFMQYAGGTAPLVSRESTKRGSITYREGVDVTSLPGSHPAIWRKIRMATPRML